MGVTVRRAEAPITGVNIATSGLRHSIDADMTGSVTFTGNQCPFTASFNKAELLEWARQVVKMLEA